MSEVSLVFSTVSRGLIKTPFRFESIKCRAQPIHNFIDDAVKLGPNSRNPPIITALDQSNSDFDITAKWKQTWADSVKSVNALVHDIPSPSVRP